MKLWQKGYELDRHVEEFTVGKDYLLDQKLVKYDCIGSIAHAKMLAKIKIISQSECKKLVGALNQLIELDAKCKFKIEQQDEDVHTAIENFLIKKLGKTGKKIHTARSRNDQVLVDIRLYSKEKMIELEEALLELCGSLFKFSSENKNIPIPGYTHMRKAMASSVGLWACSFIESLLDDLKLIKMAFEINDQSPLGSVASYGTSLPINREYVSKLLGFEKVQNNVLYVGNSRGKIEAMILSSLSQTMSTLNKIATDLLLFTAEEFGFFELPEKFLTGSSIMPNKSNPDVLEILRAKSNAVHPSLFQILSVIQNIPSGYNRDFQLTKKPLIEGMETTLSCLKITNKLIKNLKVNKEKCSKSLTPEIFAADKAIKLVEKGIPFREAYEEVWKNLNSLKEQDPEENILSKKHKGASGNLGLEKLEKQISVEKKNLETLRNRFEKKISELLI
ncbi:MAG: argininosuccinate lyase [Candidatus Aenigmatarchaeota archaeon]|nr:MAG: argininosuccinate lyase [Candidatus Aenigmarchaeota archaeon]